MVKESVVFCIGAGVWLLLINPPLMLHVCHACYVQHQSLLCEALRTIRSSLLRDEDTTIIGKTTDVM